jgi:hypothetical protein
VDCRAAKSVGVDGRFAEVTRLATKAKNESVWRQAAADILDRARCKAPTA